MGMLIINSTKEIIKMEFAKNEVMENEGNNYFKRNMKAGQGKIEVAMGCQLFNDFLKKLQTNQKGKQILEIGCCYGYNLKYMVDENGFEIAYGIEPSIDAVNFGNELYKSSNICLKQGTADNLPFQDDMFDIVMVGFCWFWMDRRYLLKAVAEADRVLKSDGILAIWDFDTSVPYVRENKHNHNVPTYKMDLAKLFEGNPQYFLAEKRSYSAAGDGFVFDRQERLSINIFIKETIEDAYVKG